jgi:hypothetical protein
MEECGAELIAVCLIRVEGYGTSLDAGAVMGPSSVVLISPYRHLKQSPQLFGVPSSIRPDSC